MFRKNIRTTCKTPWGQISLSQLLFSVFLSNSLLAGGLVPYSRTLVTLFRTLSESIAYLRGTLFGARLTGVKNKTSGKCIAFINLKLPPRYLSRLISRLPGLVFLGVLFCMNTICMAKAEPSQTLPKRIVSLGPVNTENVYLLGAGDRLVGTTRYCVRPDAAKNTEKIGSVMQVSVEKIISLQPDLVLATGLTRTSQVDLLRKVGLKVVRFDQPSSFASSCDQFEQLGRLLGLEEKAQAITAELHSQIETMVDRITQLGLTSQKVIMQIGANPLYVSGRDSFTNDFIELILAENAIGTTPSGRVDYEHVIAVDPDVILIGIMGSETGVAADERKKWAQIKVIKAVKDNRIHVVDPNLVCSPSPDTFVQALRTIVPLIYPEMAEVPKEARVVNGVKTLTGDQQ